jgi:hypothetical protein
MPTERERETETERERQRERQTERETDREGQIGANGVRGHEKNLDSFCSGGEGWGQGQQDRQRSSQKKIPN